MTGDTVPPDTTRLGYLLGPHGVQGGVKLFLLGDPAQVQALKRVYVQRKGWLKVRRTETLAPGLVLHLAGISTREAALELRDLQVYAADAELPALEDGSYYYHDLRGLTLHDPAGERLGEVVDVLDGGHQDLLVVRQAAGEALIPLQAPYVQVKVQGGKPVKLSLTADAPDDLISADDHA